MRLRLAEPELLELDGKGHLLLHEDECVDDDLNGGVGRVAKEGDEPTRVTRHAQVESDRVQDLVEDPLLNHELVGCGLECSVVGRRHGAVGCEGTGRHSKPIFKCDREVLVVDRRGVRERQVHHHRLVADVPAALYEALLLHDRRGPHVGSDWRRRKQLAALLDVDALLARIIQRELVVVPLAHSVLLGQFSNPLHLVLAVDRVGRRRCALDPFVLLV